MRSILTLTRVFFEFPNGKELFSDLTLSLNACKTALVGPNGAGKTTLARLLAGELRIRSGQIRRDGEVHYFAQREAPPPVLVQEYLGAAYAWSALGEKLLAEIDRGKPCTVLSGGEWMRARLARCLDRGFLILDEPTNDLDREGREILLEFLNAHRAGFLLISHDRECLRLCEEVLELSNQGFTKVSGGWAAYEKFRTQERARLEVALAQAKGARDRARDERAEQLARQEKRNRRGIQAAARGGLPKILNGGRKRRAQVTTGKIDRATFDQADQAVRDAFAAFEKMKVDPKMHAEFRGRKIVTGKIVAEARDFNIRFQDWIFSSDLNFSWRGDTRLALRGGNGSGKSSLLKALMGETVATRGELRRGKFEILYIDQKCASLDLEKSVFENVWDSSRLDEAGVRNALARFLFTGDSVFQPAASLSGGERLRAALAKGLIAREAPEILILDEPTNNLDLVNIEFLEHTVRGFEGAVILVSHDAEFAANCGVSAQLDLDEVAPPRKRG